VAFDTDAAAAGDANAVRDVYSRRGADPPERASQRADGTEVNRPSDRGAVSADGGTIAFGLTDGGAGQSLAANDADAVADVLVAALPATDVVGPILTVTTPTAGSSVATPTIGVSGTVADPSGVVALTVNGYRAERTPSNTFAVEVPLTIGPGTVTVRAVDGAGRSSERQIAVSREAAAPLALGVKARARGLRVVTVGRSVRLRFTLDPGATRVVVRLWRRVPQRDRAPKWSPTGPLRNVGVAPGARSVVVSPRRLPNGVYQVRVTTLSPGGASLAVIRHQAAR
jgi:hypothetical protein